MSKGESAPISRLTRESLARGTRVLRARDRRLRSWIDTVGDVRLRRQRHQFGALCRSILAQQLGSGAARTIHGRFLALFGTGRSPRPGDLLAVPENQLRACGISAPKQNYLRALAREFHEGSLRRARLDTLPDREVVDLLTRLPGIGVWTAEMFLIFSLGRLDVFSAGDFALRNGVERVEGRALTRVEVAEVARRWSPYRSVASLYLWKISHWKPEEP